MQLATTKDGSRDGPRAVSRDLRSAHYPAMAFRPVAVALDENMSQIGL